MDMRSYYKEVLSQRLSVLESYISDSDSFIAHTASHNYLKDYEILLSTITGPERNVFEIGCREFQYSLEALAFGNYRHAFSSLRLSFELFSATFYFSAHRLKMNLWQKGKNDLLWSAINDPDKGIYSHTYLQAFNPEMGTYRTQYMNLAASAYRECSEYVHGNPGTLEIHSRPIVYNKHEVTSYHDKAETIKICILFCYVVRYLEEIGDDGKRTVEHVVMDSFGDLPEVQYFFGAR